MDAAHSFMPVMEQASEPGKAGNTCNGVSCSFESIILASFLFLGAGKALPCDGRCDDAINWGLLLFDCRDA